MDEKQRFAAAAMVVAIREAIYRLVQGRDAPNSPYSWADPAEFKVYEGLRRALIAAQQTNLTPKQYFEPTCAECANFKACRSDRADVAPQKHEEGRTMSSEDAALRDTGVCIAGPPIRQHIPGGNLAQSISFFRRVHKDWSCDHWTPVTTQRGYLS